MIINAKFITSFNKFDENFAVNFSEVAFLGRSNVGKSSLINTLCKQKIAKSSSTPGKTQLINFFECECKKENERFKINLIDLPGFGYARVSKSLKSLWNKHLDEFLKQREVIRLFIHLIDARHSELEIDASVNEYLNSFLRPSQRILRVFTKSDKLNQAQKTKLKNANPGAILISNLKKSGIEEFEKRILQELFGG